MRGIYAYFVSVFANICVIFSFFKMAEHLEMNASNGVQHNSQLMSGEALIRSRTIRTVVVLGIGIILIVGIFVFIAIVELLLPKPYYPYDDNNYEVPLLLHPAQQEVEAGIGCIFEVRLTSDNLHLCNNRTAAINLQNMSDPSMQAEQQQQQSMSADFLALRFAVLPWVFDNWCQQPDFNLTDWFICVNKDEKTTMKYGIAITRKSPIPRK